MIAGLLLATVVLGRVEDPPALKPRDQRPKPASSATPQEEQSARQVTVFAILATPGTSAPDPRLQKIQERLHKVLPEHSFKLVDVRSKRIRPGQSVTCELGNGYRTETTMVRSLDENGKVQLRCALAHNGTKEFSTLVKTPANQLFFFERSLQDGNRVLIGVGAREAPGGRGASQ